MQTFALPPDIDPEPGQPLSIRHGCDYMRAEDGVGLDFYYNYLDYTWAVGGRSIGARCYLDTSDEIDINVSRAIFDQLHAVDILAFVQRRFRVIRTLEGGGYQTQWTLEQDR